MESGGWFREDKKTRMTISEKVLKMKFPRNPNLYEQLCNLFLIENVKSVKVWKPNSELVNIKRIKREQPASQYKFNYFFDSTIPGDFGEREYLLVGVTSDIEEYHTMMEQLKALNSINLLMVVNIVGNETLDKLLQDAVGLNGKFLAIPGSAQECIKRISNYIITNTWSEETSMKKTNPELAKKREMSIDEMIAYSTKKLSGQNNDSAETTMAKMSIDERISNTPALNSIRTTAEQGTTNKTNKFSQF